MCKETVKSGLNLFIVAVVSLILVTFYHEQIAQFLLLSAYSETMLVYFGFFWSGVSGCLGILLTIAGLVRSAEKDPGGRLAPTVIFLAATLIIYIILFYSSFTTTKPATLRPGEAITI